MNEIKLTENFLNVFAVQWRRRFCCKNLGKKSENLIPLENNTNTP